MVLWPEQQEKIANKPELNTMGNMIEYLVRVEKLKISKVKEKSSSPAFTPSPPPMGVGDISANKPQGGQRGGARQRFRDRGVCKTVVMSQVKEALVSLLLGIFKMDPEPDPAMVTWGNANHNFVSTVAKQITNKKSVLSELKIRHLVSN